MAIVTIPKQNWARHLVYAVATAKTGDVFIVHSEAVKKLGERRMKRDRPGVEVVFLVKQGNG